MNHTTLHNLALQILEAFIWILLNVNLSLNQTLLTFVSCQTNLDDSISSGNFSVTGYLPLIWKDPNTHMLGCAVYVKEGLPLTLDLLLPILTFLTGFTLHSKPYFFFLYGPPLSLFTVFDSISSNIDEVLSINPSGNVLFFGDFIRTG